MLMVRAYKAELDLNNRQITSVSAACRSRAVGLQLGAAGQAGALQGHQGPPYRYRVASRTQCPQEDRCPLDVPGLQVCAAGSPVEPGCGLRSSSSGGAPSRSRGSGPARWGIRSSRPRRRDLGSFRLTGRIVVSEKAIVLPRLGRLRLKERGYLPSSGVAILSATVSEQAGHWYVSVQVEEEHVAPENTGPVVGIDLGIKNLATLSDGTMIPNPRHLKRRLKKLKRLQRVVSRRKKGGKNRKKAVRKLAKQHRQHQEPTTRHAASGDHQAGENQVGAGDRRPECRRACSKNHRLAQAIGDVGFY